MKRNVERGSLWMGTISRGSAMARTRVTLTVSLPFDLVDHVNEIADAEKINFSQACALVLQRGKAYLRLIEETKK